MSPLAIYQIRFRSLGPAGGCADWWRRWRQTDGAVCCGFGCPCEPVLDLMHHQRRASLLRHSCRAPRLRVLPHLPDPAAPQSTPSKDHCRQGFQLGKRAFRVSFLGLGLLSSLVEKSDELRIIKGNPMPHAPVTLTQISGQQLHCTTTLSTQRTALLHLSLGTSVHQPSAPTQSF